MRKSVTLSSDAYPGSMVHNYTTLTVEHFLIA